MEFINVPNSPNENLNASNYFDFYQICIEVLPDSVKLSINRINNPRRK